jgi:hypothetical protein
MKRFWQKVAGGVSAQPQDAAQAAAVADVLSRTAGVVVYPESVAAEGGALLALARRGLEKSLLAVWPAGKTPAVARHLKGRALEINMDGTDVALLEEPCSPDIAAALRQILPWTAPQLVGGRPSVGLGDRLGLATPGHVRAVRGTGYVPMLAQQSIREMMRTGRSPQQVIDDATWGVFQTGFRDGFGADADHLKTPEDINRCAAAGFRFFTVDSGDHVDNAAATDSPEVLAGKFDALPWAALGTSAADSRREYASCRADLGGGEPIAFTDAALHRAGVKYGRAVAHAAALYRHLAGRLGEGTFELEVSVDETDAPTSAAEHYYVARELARLGVRWVSLAPRFAGRFEKGVDFIGDLAELERTFAAHLAVADQFGGYKISLHSGSDKFSVYPVAARHGGRRVHVKTAGTSYLEALRVLAAKEPLLFREILDLARCRYETDKATYHVSADVDRVPIACVLADWHLPGLLDAFDARQVLHVTYGSVLTAGGGRQFRGRLLAALQTHEEAYAEALAKHLGRHLAPFLASAPELRA